MKFKLKNGDEIILSKKGNTYIGVTANEIGILIRRFNLSFEKTKEILIKTIQ